jgi:hypothetical protein
MVGRVAVVGHWGMVPAVDAQAIMCTAPRAGQSAGVELGKELPVTGLLVHQLDSGEVHGRLLCSP